ncbi:MAG TPA: hypothetical protein VGO67_25605 [Verrucomicrobiae bacterium]|jgi:hypothetical protein
MKNLLTKFRLSNELDEKSGVSMPGDLRKAVDASPELQDFSRRADALDRDLRKKPEVARADESLHQSIMRTVRSAERTQGAKDEIQWRLGTDALPWMAGLALAAFAIWLAVRPAAPGTSAESREQSLAVAKVVIDVGGQIPKSVPSVMSPLTNELACVDHDIQDTTKFVMAMLPSY